jgi:hypothetical protein
MGSSFDQVSFEALFHGPEWATKFQPPDESNMVHALIGGPLLPVAAVHNFDIEAMMNNDAVVQQARVTKQRFFGEALQKKFAVIAAQNAEIVFGQTSQPKSRVVVNYAVGITLAILFSLSAAMFTSALWHSRPERRPLGLSRDPASAAATAALIAAKQCRFEFYGTDRASGTDLQDLLEDRSCKLRDQELSVMSSSAVSTKKKSMYLLLSHSFVPQKSKSTVTDSSKRNTRTDWRPTILHGWSGASASLFMVALIVGISILYVKSKASALYQTFFVYQKTYSIGKGITANIAPYSIIPTLLAIVVKLWWGGLEDTFKRLQPYVAMRRQPTKATRGIALSYVDSVLL